MRLPRVSPDLGHEPVLMVGAGFVLFATVFFSLSHSKLVTYLLPALPALAYAEGAETLDVPRSLQARDDSYVLRVRGKSMIDDLIDDRHVTN